MASPQFWSSFMLSLANAVSEPKEQGLHTLGLLVHGPQLRFLDSGPPQEAMEGDMTFAIKEYFSFPLTFNCPQLPFLGRECYSKHQLFVAFNACPFPALASSCNVLLPRQSTGSVKWMETKNRFGGRNAEGNREKCSLQWTVHIDTLLCFSIYYTLAVLWGALRWSLLKMD